MIILGVKPEGGLNDAMDALEHEYRRRLLLALCEHNPQDATDPQGWVETPRPESGGSADENTSQLMMYHAHLPKLDAAGFIDWDRDANQIHKGRRFSDLRPLLDAVDAQ